MLYNIGAPSLGAATKGFIMTEELGYNEFLRDQIKRIRERLAELAAIEKVIRETRDMLASCKEVLTEVKDVH